MTNVTDNRKAGRALKILFLYNRVRVGLEEKIRAGEDHDGHFFGMYRLRKFGIETEYLEIEQYLPMSVAKYVRDKILNIHYVHLPLFLKVRRFDIVFTSTALGSLLVKALLGLRRPKWVIFDYGLEGMIGSGRTFKQKALAFMAKKAEGIIAISPGEARAMQERFPEKRKAIRFFHLGVDTLFFKPDFDVKQESLLLSPGRDPGRDVKALIEATAGLGAEVHITSRPWNVKKLGDFPEHVSRHDFSPRELVAEYRKAKMVVIPLRLDGGLNNAMGCSTLVEAMAMGKAIIATRTETTEAYITHGVNGLLVPEGNVQALREAIVFLLKDDALRLKLGKSARQFAEKECDADLFAKKLKDYFGELMEGEKMPRN